MTRGAWIALGVVGVIAAGAGVYFLALRPGAGASSSLLPSGQTRPPPPPPESSPETTWGGRALSFLDHALDAAPDIIESWNKAE